MNERSFKTINGLELVIKNRKSAVIFEIKEQEQSNNDYRFLFNFTKDDFNKLLKYIENIAYESWANLVPKEADSIGTDYCEYYDKDLDNNGCLTIEYNRLCIERPSLESKKLYQFNKKKMESFIYDFRRKLCQI